MKARRPTTQKARVLLRLALKQRLTADIQRLFMGTCTRTPFS
jgi:hypothetical protein